MYRHPGMPCPRHHKVKNASVDSKEPIDKVRDEVCDKAKSRPHFVANFVEELCRARATGHRYHRSIARQTAGTLALAPDTSHVTRSTWHTTLYKWPWYVSWSMGTACCIAGPSSRPAEPVIPRRRAIS